MSHMEEVVLFVQYVFVVTFAVAVCSGDSEFGQAHLKTSYSDWLWEVRS